MESILTIIGGVGLFLLGMALMGEGLKGMAGATLRSVLSRFAGGRFRSVLSGFTITALVQSSSATTLMAIGFVSAGLLSFQNSIGIIFGANLGTTSTSWIVTLLGLKVSMYLLALPLVAVGALLSLLGKNRLSFLGRVLSGFGVVFVGIEFMKQGMAGPAGNLIPASLGPTGILSGLILAGIGMAMTVLMQSSSAAVATTLAALYTGNITFAMAAYMVIGQNVGTTVTAALASLGATVPAKRTALSHILFNILTGLIALFGMSWILGFIDFLTGNFTADPTVRLALFHTLFNILGVLVIMPFHHRFANLVTRIIPEKRPSLIRHLDETVTGVSSVALESARRTAVDITERIAELVESMLTENDVRGREIIRTEIEGGLDRLHDFMALIRRNQETDREYDLHVSIIHALDHLDQLVIETRDERMAGFSTSREGPDERARDLSRAVEIIHYELAGIRRGLSPESLSSIAETLQELRKTIRADVIARTADGEMEPSMAFRQIEALRWMERVSYRFWRAAYYLNAGGRNSMEVDGEPGPDQETPVAD
jgi:phosphate:Na+ symporter